jgi:hypothetical protein
MPNRSRLRTVVTAGLIAVVVAPAGWLVLLNGFANLVLPGLLSREPARLAVDWDFVWMWVPGRVVAMDGLSVRGAGPRGSWSLDAAEVAGEVELGALIERRLELGEVRASGVVFRSDHAAGPQPRGAPWPVHVAGRAVASRIEVDGASFEGELVATGELWVGDALSASLDATVARGAVALDGAAVVSELGGDLHLDLRDLPRDRRLGRAAWSHLSGRASLRADIDTFSFLAPYLERAPWMSLVGTGTLSTRVALENGELLPGSVVDAETRDLTVRFLSYDIRGDGEVHAEVHDLLGMAESRMEVRFGAFIIGEPGVPPLVEGAGFTLYGASPHVSLAEPFENVALALELPPSRVPSLPLYNSFLPTDVGFSLTGGRGTVQGDLSVSTVDGVATGAATLEGDEVTARFDDLALAFDFRLDAPLREAKLTDRVYDFSGARLALTDFGLEELTQTDDRGPRWSRERDWWATVTVPRGRALVGRREYLDAQLDLEAADSTAFVRFVSQRKDLPGWMQQALAIPGVSGSGHLVVGLGVVHLEPMSLVAGRHLEVALRWHRRNLQSEGSLFAAWRGMSVGYRFEGDARELVPFGARGWFTSAAAGTVATTPVGDAEQSRRPVIRWTRKPKPPSPPDE